MYLSKIEIDRRNSEIRKAIADCQQMHRFVTGLFGTDRESAQALYRTNMVGEKMQIYIYSRQPVIHIPTCNIQQKDISSWLNRMEENQVWKFDLIASPSKKIPVEGKKNSRRRILRTPEERKMWLDRKARQHGFEILHSEEHESIHTTGKHKAENGGDMYHDAYRYQGVLRITDAEKFRQAIGGGIGPGKAYGFGMMLLKY